PVRGRGSWGTSSCPVICSALPHWALALRLPVAPIRTTARRVHRRVGRAAPASRRLFHVREYAPAVPTRPTVRGRPWLSRGARFETHIRWRLCPISPHDRGNSPC